MTIDPRSDDLVTFRELANQLPVGRHGRPLHISTVHRMRSPGRRGIQLEALRIGGVWCTTWSAFTEFCQRVSEPGDQPTEAASTRAADRANAELERGEW